MTTPTVRALKGGLYAEDIVQDPTGTPVQGPTINVEGQGEISQPKTPINSDTWVPSTALAGKVTKAGFAGTTLGGVVGELLDAQHKVVADVAALKAIAADDRVANAMYPVANTGANYPGMYVWLPGSSLAEDVADNTVVVPDDVVLPAAGRFVLLASGYSPPGAVTLTGDVSGTAAANVVEAIQGNAVQAGAATTQNQAYLWNAGNSRFELGVVALASSVDTGLREARVRSYYGI